MFKEMIEGEAEKILPVSCNYDCISGCPLEAVVSKGKVVRVRNNSHRRRYMSGCPRGFHSPSVLYHPSRLRSPLIRTGRRGEGEFREAEWEEALDLGAVRLSEIKERYGASALMRIGGSGSCRGVVHNTAVLTMRFLSLFGGYTDTHGTYSSAATDFVKPHLFGTKYVGIDIKTVLSSKLIILWGFNAADTRFGTETCKVLDEAHTRGIPIVVVDPRRTRSVDRFSAVWLPLYPGSDGVLMTAMIYQILEDGDVHRGCVERYSVGFEELEGYIMGKSDGRPKDPRWAAPLTGLSEGQIREFARRFARARPAALLPGLSIQRTLGGEEADRLAAVLQLIRGNIGVPGGSSGSGQWNVLPPPKMGKVTVPPNPAASSVSVYRWADVVLDPEEGPEIKALYSVGGNYALQGSDTKKSLRALGASEFTFCHDPFFTETCRWADVVLPTSTFLERRDVLASPSNYLFYSERVAEPLQGVKNDYDIFAELARRLGFEREFTEGLDADSLLSRCIEESEIENVEEFVSTGIYSGADQHRVGLADFIADPDRCPLETPSGKIEISSESYRRAGGTAIPEAREHAVNGTMAGAYPLRMVTPHALGRVNSQFYGIEPLHSLNDDRLWINPVDADKRGIRDGSRVIVESKIGKMYGIAKVSRDILGGVVSCNQGVRSKLSPQGEELAGSVNMLTSTEPTLPSGGSRTHSIDVEVWKVEEK